MLPNADLSPDSGSGFGPIEDRYQSPEYNSQPKSLFPYSSSNPFLNDRMMVMMMLEKMRADRVSSNQ